jgi:hypothetical protein
MDVSTSSEQHQSNAAISKEDGTVMVYGFVLIKDGATGEILLSTRS